MADPRPHVGIIRHGFFPGVGGQQVHFSFVFARPIDGEAAFFGQAFQAGGADRFRVVGQVFQVKLVAKDADLVLRQSDRRVLMAVVHLDVPGFLLVRDHGDVDFAASIAVQQGGEDLDALPGRGALAGDQVHRGQLRQPRFDQGIGLQGRSVGKRGDGHDHGDAVFVRADGGVAGQAVQGHGAVHPGGGGVAEGGGWQLGKHGGAAVHGHRPARDVLDPLGDSDIVGPDILVVVGLGQEDGAVGADGPADVDGRTGGGAGGVDGEHQADSGAEQGFCGLAGFFHG